ncbi:MAG: GTP-binding protein [Promethearchaeota archaeon]
MSKQDEPGPGDQHPVAFNIGLFGHVDSGKTAIARVLTEIVSTAGLDAHPQSKRRGITIDLGFTFFRVGKFLVTLVDAPGHADLIQSVVSAARIIDAAVVVVDGKEGPQIQTGEHLVVLECLGIDRVVFALNKVDLLGEEEVEAQISALRGVIADTKFPDAPVVPVSAVERKGFGELRRAIEGLLHEPVRDEAGAFVMPIDHHFPIRGKGTVVTGTVLSGTVSVGDQVTVLPARVRVKVRSIQVAKEARESVGAGNRAGIALSGVSPDRLKRGYHLTDQPDLAKEVQFLFVRCQLSHFFKGAVKFAVQVHATLGMTTVAGLLYPSKSAGGDYLAIPEVGGFGARDFHAVLLLQEAVTLFPGSTLLVSRFDLPPTTLRVLGSGDVVRVLNAPPTFLREKVKRGIVKNPSRANGVVVEKAFLSREGAAKYVGARVLEPPGRISSTFGTKGDFVLQLDDPGEAQALRVGDPVEIRLTRRFNVKLPDWFRRKQ